MRPPTKHTTATRLKGASAGLALLLLSCRVNLPAPGTLTDGGSCAQPREVRASADSWVDESNPSSGHGSATSLKTDEGPELQAYLRFDVTGLSGAAAETRLRIQVRNGSDNGPAVYATSNSWDEKNLAWNNRPAPIGPKLAEFGKVAEGPTDVRLSAPVNGDGTYSFVLIPQSSDGMDFDSRETSSPPALLLGGNCPAALRRLDAAVGAAH